MRRRRPPGGWRLNARARVLRRRARRLAVWGWPDRAPWRLPGLAAAPSSPRGGLGPSRGCAGCHRPQWARTTTSMPNIAVSAVFSASPGCRPSPSPPGAGSGGHLIERGLRRVADDHGGDPSLALATASTMLGYVAEAPRRSRHRPAAPGARWNWLWLRQARANGAGGGDVPPLRRPAAGGCMAAAAGRAPAAARLRRPRGGRGRLGPAAATGVQAFPATGRGGTPGAGPPRKTGRGLWRRPNPFRIGSQRAPAAARTGRA